jgi:hypothetical protein
VEKAQEILRASPAKQFKSPTEIANSLDAFVIEETENTIRVLYRALGLKRDDKSIDYPWTSIEKDISRMEEILNRRLALIQEMERPKFGPFIQMLQRRKQQAVLFHKFEKSAISAVEKAPSIMETVSKGLQLISP